MSWERKDKDKALALSGSMADKAERERSEYCV
jgi:hypothetical protein